MSRSLKRERRDDSTQSTKRSATSLGPGELGVRPGSSELGKWGSGGGSATDQAADQLGADKPKDVANFGLTGALAKDIKTGNAVQGVVKKFSEPPDSASPSQQWRLYVFKSDNLLQTIHIHRKSAFLIGRDDRVADIPLDHESCSKQHAVIQYRLVPVKCSETAKITRVVKPYLMDLGSSNKTFLNGVEIEDARYIELRDKDVVRFGASTREYVLMQSNL